MRGTPDLSPLDTTGTTHRSLLVSRGVTNERHTHTHTHTHTLSVEESARGPTERSAFVLCPFSHHGLALGHLILTIPVSRRLDGCPAASFMERPTGADRGSRSHNSTLRCSHRARQRPATGGGTRSPGGPRHHPALTRSPAASVYLPPPGLGDQTGASIRGIHLRDRSSLREDVGQGTGRRTKWRLMDDQAAGVQENKGAS